MNNIDFHYHHTPHHKIQTQSKKTLWISLILTTLFAFLELFGGIFSGSLALISDSFHMFSDVLALLLSMVAIYYAAKKPNNKFTYGYVRFEIIAALLNGIALIIIGAGILYEGVARLINPVEIDFTLMMTIAVIGLMINIVLTVVLMRSLKAENNLNIKSALWHFLGDLFNSVGIIIAALLIKWTGIIEIDAIVSLIVSVIICFGGYKICKAAFFILMEAVPDELNCEDIHQTILAVDGVKEIHEFHLWSVTEKEYSLSFHVLLNCYDNINDYEIIKQISDTLKTKHNIEHVTIQIENPAINDHHEQH
ncbi:cation transporter [Pasteurellaceae bacterium Orientalotternb1]|nr:cation transporter [Pasteurellaceae bacterium Orientalotternb1]